MLAPLVMDLADKKIPVKIVSLGHRSGAVIMVRGDSPYKKFKDLTGKPPTNKGVGAPGRAGSASADAAAANAVRSTCLR